MFLYLGTIRRYEGIIGGPGPGFGRGGAKAWVILEFEEEIA
jgi:hypothetical protein